MQFAMDGIFHDTGATVMGYEQRKVRAYEAFKNMVIADPKADPTSIERMLHECRSYFYIGEPTGQPRNNDDE
jgi:hypothetical protein